MVLPTLSKENLLRAFIRNAIERGYSATYAYNAIKGTELGIRKSRFLELWREEAGPYAQARYAQRAPLWLVPSPNIIPKLEYAATEKYLLRAHIYYLNLETGKVRERHLTFLTNVLRSKGEMIEEIRESIAEIYRGGREIVLGVVLREWWQKK